MISYATRIIFVCYECRCVQKVVKIVCLSHDMLQSVIVSGAVIYHISNVNGVLQYTRITALCNTSVIFLAVQNNYLQDQISMVSGTNHSSLDRHFFQNDDKNDKTHRAQNVYLSRPT